MGRGGETEKADARRREAVHCAHPERSPGDGGLGMAGAAAGEEAERGHGAALPRQDTARPAGGCGVHLGGADGGTAAHAARRAEGGPEAAEPAGACCGRDMA